MTALIIDFTWHHGRYTMPLIPLQMVAAGVGAAWMFKILNSRVDPAKMPALFSGKILPLVLRRIDHIGRNVASFLLGKDVGELMSRKFRISTLH